MTTVQITLLDQLAEEAQRAGLLSQVAVEKWLREQLKTQRVDELFAAMDRMAAVDELAAISLVDSGASWSILTPCRSPKSWSVRA